MFWRQIKVQDERYDQRNFLQIHPIRPENTQECWEMFIKDLKTDFYNHLIGKRVLVVVNYDIDAICGSQILQTLFRYDQMVFSVIPILGQKGLKKNYDDHKTDVKIFLFINCGGCVDLIGKHFRFIWGTATNFLLSCRSFATRRGYNLLYLWFPPTSRRLQHL